MKSGVFAAVIFVAGLQLWGFPSNPSYSCKAVAGYKVKADSGNAECQYLYARALVNGEGTIKSEKLAFDYAVKSSRGGCRYAMRLVAMGLREGWSGKKDLQKADTIQSSFIKWAQGASDKGDAEACRLLGLCYYRGEGVEKNFDKAVAWCAKSFALGCPGGARMAGIVELERVGKERKGEKTEDASRSDAKTWFEKAFQKGDAGGAFQLARLHYNGIGVEKNQLKAFEWIVKAAEMGDEYSIPMAVDGYLNGTHGASKDIRKGMGMLQKWVDEGSPRGKSILADCRLKGKGVPKDVSKAIKLYESAAEFGDTYSMCKLGDLYREEGAIPGDIRRAINCDKESFKWYKKAADNGNEYGKFRTAIAYYCNEGDAEWGEPSERKSLKLFLQIAKANGRMSGFAERLVGTIYEQGRAGLNVDKEKALEWYEKSAEHGCEDGKKDMERLEGQMFDADTVAERRAERAKKSGSEIVTDVPALLDKAKKMGSRTFVLNGFYLGMSVDEAAVLARHFLPGANVVVTGNNDVEIDVVHKKEFDVQPMYFCRADANHAVWQFNFDARFLKKWFSYGSQTYEEWANAFARERNVRFVSKEVKGENSGILVSQQCFVYRDENLGFAISYFGEKHVFDPNKGMTMNDIAADPYRAGQIARAQEWVKNEWENEAGAHEGTLRIEILKR